MKILTNAKIKCTMADYLSYPAIGSSSVRTLVHRTPAHYLFESLQGPQESTPAQAFGTAIHQAILEPKLFKENMIVQPTFEGTGSRAARDQWHIQNHGKTILKQEQLDQIDGILKAISKHSLASKLVSDGYSEESFFWTDPESGIQCKARPDFIREGHIIVDVKTTLDAKPSSFLADIARYGYHIQAAMYLDAVSTVLDKIHDTFIIIAIEKEAPHGINCYQFKATDYSIRAAQQHYWTALKMLKECQKTDIYPSYSESLIPVELPSWAMVGE